MRVVVWSERNEPFGDHRWRDCTYCAYLMALVFAGFTRFPLGMYTVAEREAFERSDSRPDETGANIANVDEASRNRYGKVLAKPDLPLQSVLMRPGYAFVVQGENSRLPFRLRRWDPAFSGGHAATVVTTGTSSLRWLDPEALNIYSGEPITVPELVNWMGPYAQFARMAKADEFAPPKPAVPTMHAAPGVYTTYKVANGRAVAIGTLPTRGFTATYELLTVKQADGIGTATMIAVHTPSWNRLLYRFAPGISILS